MGTVIKMRNILGLLILLSYSFLSVFCGVFGISIYYAQMTSQKILKWILVEIISVGILTGVSGID